MRGLRVDAELVVETPFLLKDPPRQWHELDSDVGSKLGPVLNITNCRCRTRPTGWQGRLPVPALLAVSAVFHYLGPAFAVLLFARLNAVGVAWLRIASAAVVFAVWRRPWRLVLRLTAPQRLVLLALGTVLGR
jgi:hypothetical protein